MRIDLDTCRDPDLLAAEVRRLKDVIAAGEPTLTDAERGAVELAAGSFTDQFVQHGDSSDREIASTLRNLLERLK